MKIEWKKAIALSAISGVVSFFLFLLSQIIWGDILKDLLEEGFEKQLYTNINLILLSGMAIIFLISFAINVSIYREFKELSKLIANIFTLIFSIIAIFFIAWICVVLYLSDFYLSLSPIDRIRSIPFYLAYFAIYILDSPVYVWYLCLIIYHVILIFMIRIFYARKSSYISNRKKSKVRQSKPFYNPKKRAI